MPKPLTKRQQTAILAHANCVEELQRQEGIAHRRAFGLGPTCRMLNDDFPQELRDLIYDFVLDSDNNTIIIADSIRPPALSRVNRQLRREFDEYYYNFKTFVIPYDRIFRYQYEAEELEVRFKKFVARLRYRTGHPLGKLKTKVEMGFFPDYDYSVAHMVRWKGKAWADYYLPGWRTRGTPVRQYLGWEWVFG